MKFLFYNVKRIAFFIIILKCPTADDSLPVFEIKNYLVNYFSKMKLAVFIALFHQIFK